MRMRIFIGAALVLIGGLVVARGLSYSSSHDVVNIGGLRVSTEEKKPIPPAAGAIAAVAGLVLIFAGGSRRS